MALGVFVDGLRLYGTVSLLATVTKQDSPVQGQKTIDERIGGGWLKVVDQQLLRLDPPLAQPQGAARAVQKPDRIVTGLASGACDSGRLPFWNELPHCGLGSACATYVNETREFESSLRLCIVNQMTNSAISKMRGMSLMLLKRR